MSFKSSPADIKPSLHSASGDTMQSYTYSVFSIVAIAIHLIINFDLIVGKGIVSKRGTYYRGFLMGILAYYVTDATWGILAGLGWTKALYVETAFFFLALVAFVFTWCRFVIVYLELGKWTARILSWYGYALLTFNIMALALNPFNKCFYYFEQDNYKTGFIRDIAFFLLIAFIILMAAFVLAKAIGSRDTVRRRNMLVFLFCIVTAVSIVLNVIWPLTPFTALGCLICNCFFHIFVIQDEQTEKHTEELEKALAQARAAEKARSMFFSIVSHDIRTPLNAILGYSELLQYGIKNQEEREEALKSIRASGTTLLQLVNDVLDLAKMDAGKMIFRPEPVQLSKLTDEVFASFLMLAAEKGIELVNQTSDVPTVLIDGHRFRQILFNFVGNAVKFTTHGSVTVSASYAEECLEVSVSDTGCGIAHDMLTHILDPFVQVLDPSHAADRANGTGLGLSICKSLIEAMGGELIVESELGKGSTFKARLSGIKTYDEPIKSFDETKTIAKLKRLPKHVLVIDDSPVNRKVLTAFLKRAGIVSINHAGNGGEALAEIDSAMNAGNPYDVIFSDLWMPNINGIEFIEKLREDSRFDHLPVFALTADTEFQHDVRKNLFTGILLKPLTYDKLVQVFAVMDDI